MRNFTWFFCVRVALQTISFAVRQSREVQLQCIRVRTLYERSRMANENLSERIGHTSTNVMHDCDVRSLLSANDTRKYYIEYNGFLSNHLSHGIIALRRLGATRDRIERFIDLYSRRLESPASHAGKTSPATDKRTPPVEDLLGARASYYILVDHYTDLLAALNQSTAGLIRDEFPKLSDGLVGSTYHGLIHLGYGFAAGNSRLVCEGLAYLHHSHMPLRASSELLAKPRSSGTFDVIDVVRNVAQDVSLREFVEVRIQSDLWKQRLAGDFQRRVGVLVTEKGDELLRYTHAVELPPFFCVDYTASER
ncbi:hypothetical protein LSAT2_007545, partial [Lamellibrachia satsuma]